MEQWTEARIKVVRDILGAIGPQADEDPHDDKRVLEAVASHLGLVPTNHSIGALLRGVLTELQEDWDDDFMEEDREAPSLPAYEAIGRILAARQAQSTASVAVEEAEVDGDEIPIAEQFTFFPQQPNIETVVKRIEDGRIHLDPSWQRDFVWKPKKQRKLIESIFLRLPIPSLLLSRHPETSVLEVIDGKQRLETIARFCAPRGDPQRKRFKTFSAREEGWKEGQPLHSAAGKYYEHLPDKWKSILDDTSLTFHIFENLDPSQLYQIFSRYNTGSVALKAQEIRNAVFQETPLHRMLWSLAGEHDDPNVFQDTDEEEVATTLRSVMRNKTQRYGAYDFLGRYFAFTYRTSGTVARATYDLMMESSAWLPERIEGMRLEFIRVFRKTLEWYEAPLVKTEPREEFQAFIATLQLASTRALLQSIADGEATELETRRRIADYWPQFEEDTLALRQNSGVFWGRQDDWISCLRTGTPPRRPPELVHAAATT